MWYLCIDKELEKWLFVLHIEIYRVYIDVHWPNWPVYIHASGDFSRKFQPQPRYAVNNNHFPLGPGPESSTMPGGFAEPNGWPENWFPLQIDLSFLGIRTVQAFSEGGKEIHTVFGFSGMLTMVESLEWSCFFVFCGTQNLNLISAANWIELAVV